ncbi:MAG: FAD-dependent oxidoreductase [Anaerolineae bacterium]
MTNQLPISHVLIVGAGIAGMQASLDIANAGYDVTLVEQLPSIGGRMSQLSETFPTLDCAACIMTPRTVEVSHHPHITLMTCTDVTTIEGKVGGFHVTLEKKPRYVDLESCTGCGECALVCPVEIPSTFNAGLDTHKAIYRQFPQAVPAAFVIDKRESPCKNACPAHIPAQGYIALIAEGKFREALEQVRGAGVPFVGTLGRVCDHPCEPICKRGEWDEPVAICALKRFAYDAAVAEDHPEPIPVEWTEKVAIVGAGPAGLTAAYELVRRGYQVTVFDALPVAGGMLAVGIPEYRLPREVLKHEVDYICALGVELRLDTPVGRDGGPSLEDLRKEYDAVFLAVGAHGSRRLNVPGEHLPSLLHGASFLRRLNLGQEVQVGKRVAVIGGGNAAVDAARCALRLGAQVQLVYRRSRVEMPAIVSEVEAAEVEGVQLEFLAAPVRVLEEQGRLAGIECVRIKLGEPDASRRRRPVPIAGSEFTLDVDTVIVAVGQSVESEGLEEVETEHWGTFVADPVTLQTSLEGVFAGGDAVTGPASAVEAVGAGIQAAESIHRYLRGIDLHAGRKLHWTAPEEIVVEPAFEVRPAMRKHVAELTPAERTSSFDEVEQGFTPEQAVAEAQRCLACGVCSECMLCVVACERGSVRHDDRPEQVELDVGAIVMATGYNLYGLDNMPEYGGGKVPDVIDALTFERLLSASGPTAGKVYRPSDGEVPREVVFIQCAGSRDPEKHLPYCSKICCMYTAKQAILYRHRVHDGQAYVFYIDIRAAGKRYDEFTQRAMEDENVVYLRGKVSRIFRQNGQVMVWGADTLSGQQVQIAADLVVVAPALLSRPEIQPLAEMMGLQQDEHGWLLSRDSNMRPVETDRPGIFLAGTGTGPMDIPETVAHASGAAAQVLKLFSRWNKESQGEEQ